MVFCQNTRLTLQTEVFTEPVTSNQVTGRDKQDGSGSNRSRLPDWSTTASPVSTLPEEEQQRWLHRPWGRGKLRKRQHHDLFQHAFTAATFDTQRWCGRVPVRLWLKLQVGAFSYSTGVQSLAGGSATVTGVLSDGALSKSNR